jgi:recombinational DNA repair protein RecT
MAWRVIVRYSFERGKKKDPPEKKKEDDAKYTDLINHLRSLFGGATWTNTGTGRWETTGDEAAVRSVLVDALTKSQESGVSLDHLWIYIDKVKQPKEVEAEAEEAEEITPEPESQSVVNPQETGQ